MNTLKILLNSLFSRTIKALWGEQYSKIDPLIQPASRPEFGDYQANFALSLSKLLQSNSQLIAQQIIDKIKHEPIFSELSVSGPGFINIKISNNFLNIALEHLNTDEHLHHFYITHPKTIIVDYGGANVAKEMHVGHLRSAIIGDAIVRTLSFLGNTVIRQNHLGDWGTQFGMLIEYLLTEDIKVLPNTGLSDLNILYKQAKVKFDEDANFATRARERVVLLQNGNTQSLAIWKKLVKQSKKDFQKIYHRLHVLLQEKDNCGESFYNPQLPILVQELVNRKIAEQDKGATVIFLPGFFDQDKRPLPMIIRKSDGGYLYATTDLAAARYRLQKLHGETLIYITDARQKLHFEMLFTAIKKIGWAHEKIKLNHLAFGTVLGKDKKPFKTRSGDAIKLIDLLNEAEKRAYEVITTRNTDLPEQEKKNIARVIGIGALKYADLSNDLIRDYVFDWDRMLNFDGNTAPYLQNAYVRIQSIFRKGNIEFNKIKHEAILITVPHEHVLAIKTLQFGDTLQAICENLRPHQLCNYLYDLATTFHQFYENCPILSLEDLKHRNSRLLICFNVAKILKKGLELLGIDTLDRM